jgi:hypothetical protein
MNRLTASTCRNDAGGAFFLGPGPFELATETNSRPITGDYVRIASSVRLDECGLS